MIIALAVVVAQAAMCETTLDLVSGVVRRWAISRESRKIELTLLLVVGLVGRVGTV
jgi:hypothetical protein